MTASTERPLRKLLGYARAHGARIRLASAWSVLGKLFDLAPPLLIGTAVDIVVSRERSFIARLGIEDLETQLWVLCGVTVAIWVLESLFEYLEKVAWRNLAQTLQHELRMDVYAHVQGLELAYFEDESTGGLMSVLNDDVNQLERFLNAGASALLHVATTVVVIGAIFFWLAPEVAWMAMLPMPFILWGSIVYQKRLAPRYGAVRQQVGVLNSDLAGNLGGIATIKSFTAEEREILRIGEGSRDYLQKNERAIALSSAFSPLIRMLVVCGFSATLVAGGKLALEGRLGVGSYSVMVFLTQRLLWPLTSLGQTFDLYQRAMASVTRLLGLMEKQPAIVDGPLELPVSGVSGEVRFDGVDFAYAQGPRVLHELNLVAPAGETTAVVGATGSGKTTLVKLLLRFYDPQTGTVRLDGHDVSELRLSDLRGAIGLVSQDVFLFHGTVRENIAYGRPAATDAEIVAAARVAEADGFIADLPSGYDTVVGERGQKLSGGQRQRVSIARAVLKDPPVLVLDEATSSVDNETEAAIQRSFERIATGRTTLVIAHRLSTVRNAHRIYVMDRGRVVEVGRHDTLIEADGIYAALWRVQTGAAAGAVEDELEHTA